MEPTIMTPLLQQAANHHQANLPFVIYNKLHSEKLVGIFQKNASLNFVDDFSESGFVFAPFSGNQIVLIPDSESEILVTDFKAVTPPSGNPISGTGGHTAQKDFEKMVQQGIDAIRKGTFSKVVLSRKETVELQHFDLIAVFTKLLDQYPAAFTYCFFHPRVGLWLGAFSEQLLQMKAHHFQTMAVAGTQPLHENEIVWGDKEKAEQQFVTDFIVDNLEGRVSGLEVSEPYTLKAGNVMHIKTDIQGNLHSASGLGEMIGILHPTPAVCGLPKDRARSFILKNEGYDREYYSGFFGELNKDFAHGSNATDLYVNLRCMQVKGSQALIYVGGGVTKDSVPEKEWQETVNKAQTMKRILESQ